MSGCPGRLALCGVPCGCDGRNASHYPPDDDSWRAVRFLAPDLPHDDDQETDQ